MLPAVWCLLCLLHADIYNCWMGRKIYLVDNDGPMFEFAKVKYERVNG